MFEKAQIWKKNAQTIFQKSKTFCGKNERFLIKLDQNVLKVLGCTQTIVFRTLSIANNHYIREVKEVTWDVGKLKRENTCVRKLTQYCQIERRKKWVKNFRLVLSKLHYRWPEEHLESKLCQKELEPKNFMLLLSKLPGMSPGEHYEQVFFENFQLMQPKLANDWRKKFTYWRNDFGFGLYYERR